MLFLINNTAINKYRIIQLVYQGSEIISVEKICSEIQCHPITLNKWITEINDELNFNFLVRQGGTLLIQKKEFNPFNYYCFLCKNDLPILIFTELIFGNQKHTLLSLAQKLCVSRSKLYSAIKKINSRFHAYSIELQLNNTISIVGDIFSLINLIYEMYLQKNELLYMEYDPYLYTITTKILEVFSIKKDMLTLKYFYIWIHSYIQYKLVEKNSQIKVLDTNNLLDQLNISILNNEVKFVSLINKLEKHFFKRKFLNSDIFNIFAGLLLAAPKFHDENKRDEFFELQTNIYSNYIYKKSILKFEKQVLDFFTSSEKSDSEKIIFRNSLQTILFNFNIFSIRYCEYAFVQNISPCPPTIMASLKTMGNKDTYLNFAMDILMHIIWFIFKIYKYNERSKLIHPKIVFKSSLGVKQEERLKQLFLNQFIVSDSSTFTDDHDIVYIVDDDRLLIDSKTISIDSFFNQTNY